CAARSLAVAVWGCLASDRTRWHTRHITLRSPLPAGRGIGVLGGRWDTLRCPGDLAAQPAPWRSRYGEAGGAMGHPGMARTSRCESPCRGVGVVGGVGGLARGWSLMLDALRRSWTPMLDTSGEAGGRCSPDAATAVGFTVEQPLTPACLGCPLMCPLVSLLV